MFKLDEQTKAYILALLEQHGPLSAQELVLQSEGKLQGLRIYIHLDALVKQGQVLLKYNREKSTYFELPREEKNDEAR